MDVIDIAEHGVQEYAERRSSVGMACMQGPRGARAAGEGAAVRCSCRRFGGSGCGFAGHLSRAIRSVSVITPMKEKGQYARQLASKKQLYTAPSEVH